MKTIYTFILIMSGFYAFAQATAPIATPQKTKELPKILPSWDVEAGYGGHLAAGDLAERFGAANYLHGGVHYKNDKLWFYGIDGGYFFGYELKEDPLRGLRTPDGNILGKDKEYAFVDMDERGFLLGAIVGKIIPLSKRQRQSGLRTSLSIGYMQHSIRIQDNNAQVPSIAENYAKGYDRLTGGLQITEFVGYQIVDSKGFINFFGGVESTQGFTKSMRSWQTDLQMKDTRNRLDVLMTARIGITLAIRKQKPNEIFY